MNPLIDAVCDTVFQHTAARRRLGFVTKSRKLLHWFQHTAARRRLAALYSVQTGYVRVSTHSRPKAAGFASMQLLLFRQGFNTQPPEGGWLPVPDLCPVRHRFNTQPPEGGWGRVLLIWGGCPRFNTQPPEGGCLLCSRCRSHISVSTRSRPKAAGFFLTLQVICVVLVSTRSRPKALGMGYRVGLQCFEFQHAAARRRLAVVIHFLGRLFVFQHAAARRRLVV